MKTTRNPRSAAPGGPAKQRKTPRKRVLDLRVIRLPGGVEIIRGHRKGGLSLEEAVERYNRESRESAALARSDFLALVREMAGLQPGGGRKDELADDHERMVRAFSALGLSLKGAADEGIDLARLAFEAGLRWADLEHLAASAASGRPRNAGRMHEVLGAYYRFGQMPESKCRNRAVLDFLAPEADAGWRQGLSAGREANLMSEFRKWREETMAALLRARDRMEAAQPGRRAGGGIWGFVEEAERDRRPPDPEVERGLLAEFEGKWLAERLQAMEEARRAMLADRRVSMPKRDRRAEWAVWWLRRDGPLLDRETAAALGRVYARTLKKPSR